MEKSLRQRKISYLQKKQRELKGLPIKEIQLENGLTRVKRITSRRLMTRPKEIKKIVRKSIPIKKERLSELKSKGRSMKRKLPIRYKKMLY